MKGLEHLQMSYERLRRRPDGVPVYDEETKRTKMLTLPTVSSTPNPQRAVFYDGRFMTIEQFQTLHTPEPQVKKTLFRGSYMTDEEIQDEIMRDRH